MTLTTAARTSHPLHADDRIWQETNCYADLWIELLHGRGHDPVPALTAAISAGFDGEQWTFVKPHPEDLRAMYGATVTEVNIWRPLQQHVLEHLARGRTVTVEVDSFWLPDTAATTYRTRHAKTTLAVTECDPIEKRLGYYHGAGWFSLEGEDFDGAMRCDPEAPGLPPYVETVFWTAAATDSELPALTHTALSVAAARRPAGNQAAALAERLRTDLDGVKSAGVEVFHDYAFGTARQCGAALLLSADVVSWLSARGGPAELTSAAEHFLEAAQAAKVLQFQLARVAAGRRDNVDDALATLVDAWTAADTALDDAGFARDVSV